MKLDREEKGALGVAALAAAVTLASAALTVKRRRLLPAMLTLGGAYLALGAVSMLDGAYRAELAADADGETEELFYAAACDEAAAHIGDALGAE